MTAAPADADAPHRIIGGSDADQTYSFMVALPGCGGSLIAPQWVLTAAHCVDEGGPEGMVVRIGSNDEDHGGETIGAEKLILHEGYPDTVGHDIALIKLNKPAQATPIKIATEAPEGTKSRILGWGQINTGPIGEKPDTLQQLDTSVIPDGECTSAMDPELDICTDNPGGDSSACYGDSGGPELTGTKDNWELIGVASRGGVDPERCAVTPTIYTSAVAHTDWIKQHMSS